MLLLYIRYCFAGTTVAGDIFYAHFQPQFFRLEVGIFSSSICPRGYPQKQLAITTGCHKLWPAFFQFRLERNHQHRITATLTCPSPSDAAKLTAELKRLQLDKHVATQHIRSIVAGGTKV